MLANLAYDHDSELTHDGAAAWLRLFPNLRRDPALLRARLVDPVPFRDALLALHDAARSELFVSQAEVDRRVNDPVITIAAKSAYFEAFSRDESTYARVTVRANAFDTVDALTPGCTNIDFPDRLRLGLEQIRSGTRTSLVVAPSGVEVNVGPEVLREEKIDLPDGWVHGFLAVQSSMRRPGAWLDLHTGDFRNLVTYLRGRKETVSPRSLRFQLDPGRPPRVVVEPWGEELVFERSGHDAAEPREIRIWGRCRLLTLQRALPAARRVRALLQGTGLPSFWTLDLGAVELSLGLSPWSERDWTADAVPLPDAAPPPLQAEIDRVAVALAAKGPGLAERIARDADVTGARALAALDALCGRGRVLYDPGADTFVARHLFDGDPPAPPAPDERLAAAAGIVDRQGVRIIDDVREPARRTLRARVKGTGTYEVTALLDAAGHVVGGACACPFFARFGLQRGACKHVLAVAITVDGR